MPNTTNTKKATPMPIKKSLRQLGEGGITKQELSDITKSSGKSGGKVIQKLDQLNKKIRGNDGVGISLNSGAANMLIRQANKSPNSFEGYMGSQFGPGRIGSQLQARASGKDLQGNPGNFMLGGTAIRPGGREATQGFGKQYQYAGGATQETLPGGDNTDTLTGGDGGDTLPTFNFTMPEIQLPEFPALPAADTPSMLMTGAGSWRRSGKGKGKGIKSTQTAAGKRTMPTSSTLGM